MTTPLLAKNIKDAFFGHPCKWGLINGQILTKSLFYKDKNWLKQIW